jgi:formylglycine-generating enzyme required for sulfatase activity
MYWHKIDGQWMQYTLSGLQPLDSSAPVTHVSQYEAAAYAHWRSKRLLTEAEWEAFAQKYSPNIPASANFVEQEHYHPTTAADNNMQLLGDCWEWTNSAYLPYPGYQQPEGALGEYNGKFMINQMVLRGGSCATPISHIRHTYRNFFQPWLRWQFTGIRLAESI